MIISTLKREKNLTSGPLIPQIFMFVLPLIATSVLQLLFNTADTVVVGRWGGDTPEASANSLAAVGSCSSLINLCVNLFIGISTGAGICCAHAIGAGHRDEVKKTVHTSVVFALIAGAVVTLIGMVGARPLLSLMGTDAVLLDEAVLYMRAYFCGMPAAMLYNYCAAILRSKGETVRPLIFLTVAGVVNVLLNLVTVIVFRWGAVGVGTATAVSQWVSCILVVIFMMRMDDDCRIELKQIKADRATVFNILRVGLPAGIQSSFFSISNVLIQSSINSFGPVVVAGSTAALNLEGYVYAAQNGFYHAVLPFMAQNAGAGKVDRMKKIGIYCSFLVLIVGAAIGCTVYLFSHPLLSIYAPGNEAVIAAGKVRLGIICLFYPLCGLMEVGSGCVRGLGKSILPTVVSLVGSCLLRVVWVYTVFAWIPTPPGADEYFRLAVLFASYPVTWLITAAVHYCCAVVEMRKFRRQLESPMSVM